MTEYVDVFREEAKSLFSAYKNQEQDAVKRCAKVFGDKTDLTLMNIQHVIAKEYGFNQWNDIVKAEKWDLAGALNLAQNKNLTSPLKIGFEYKEEVYDTAERFKPLALAPRDNLDLVNFQMRFRDNYVSSHIHLGMVNVSQADLSRLDISKASFDEWTIWPEDKEKMPKNFNPREFLEKRKNPGLGIRKLHKMGITGKGRNVAIIGDSDLCSHLEYRESLADYVDLSVEKSVGDMFGWGVAVVAGKDCGVAPDAKVYCYQIDSHYKASEKQSLQLVQAFKHICDLHQKLLAEGKNGIDVVIVAMPLASLSEEVQQIVDEMAKLCVYVIDRRFIRQRVVECTMYGDVDNPDDFVLYGGKDGRPDREKLCLIGFGQTVPCGKTIGSYLFNTTSELMWFWQGGLFVLCRSVKPDLTLEEFGQIALKTGDFREGIGVIVNPRRLIEALRG